MSNSIADLFMSGGGRGPGEMGSFVMGTVTENNEKKFPGMVKVEFTSWTAGKNICEWIPLLRPYAGAGYGQYIKPEIGDVVLVGFLGAAQQKPFVMGMFYPANAAFVKESFEKENMTKRFKTKGGLDVTLSDVKDKQSVTVLTPKGLTVTISDETESVEISDKDAKNVIQLDCKNGALALTSDKKMTLKAGKCELTMDGQGGAVTLKADKITLDGGQTTKVAGKQSLNLEGGMLKAEGKQTAELKGGTMTTVAGQILKLN